MPEDPQAATVNVSLASVAVSGASEIDILELATPYGGKIDAEPDPHHKLVPGTAQYRVTLDVLDPESAPTRALRGTARLTGARESFLARAWRRVLTVLVRESGA
jgi:putative peptide zinc metalloprotease protein